MMRLTLALIALLAVPSTATLRGNSRSSSSSEDITVLVRRELHRRLPKKKNEALGVGMDCDSLDYEEMAEGEDCYLFLSVYISRNVSLLTILFSSSSV